MTVSVSAKKGFLIPTVPQVMECSININKVSMRQICKQYKIPYRRTVADYDLNVSDYEETDDEDESNVSVDQLNQYSFNASNEDLYESPIPSKAKKKKKTRERYTVSKPKKRRNAEELTPNNKRQKTSAKSHSPVVIGSTDMEDIHNSRRVGEYPPKSVKSKKNGKTCNKRNYLSDKDQNCESLIVPSMLINGVTPVSHLKTTLQLDNDSVNNQSLNRSSNKYSKPKQKPPNRPKREENNNKVIEFCSERFLYSDIFDSHCQCEQDCELDELSMAFHILMTFPEHNLPKDLKFAVRGRSADLLSSEDDRSDQNLDELLPGVDDIYQQTIEDDDSYLNEYISDFVEKTSQIPVTSSAVNPTITRDPQPSCSGVSASGQTYEPNNGVSNEATDSGVPKETNIT